MLVFETITKVFSIIFEIKIKKKRKLHYTRVSKKERYKFNIKLNLYLVNTGTFVYKTDVILQMLERKVIFIKTLTLKIRQLSKTRNVPSLGQFTSHSYLIINIHLYCRKHLEVERNICICTCVCVYMYVYTHTHMHKHTHTFKSNSPVLTLHTL